MSSDGNKKKLGGYVRHVGDGSRFTLLQAFACARSGLRYAIRSQRNFKIHSVFALLAIVLSFALQISVPEWCAIVICIALVYALELANTAVESAIDLVSPGWNELAKRAKDCAAAAVYVAALASVVIACIVFIPRACALLGIWG
ncbi:MAG: diacylglycerol kinase family protein [Eggerthellaceae bacterium]|nr:diacylglycerol kinase family protein [Eggerthellaceae bacterium]